MNEASLLFFGSTGDSVIVLDKLFTHHFSTVSIKVSAVVTQPPRPVGRKQVLTPTPVEVWAKAHAITCLSFASDPEKSWLFADEPEVINALEPIGADLLISASYGQKIPVSTLTDARFGGLNVHPSILPRWRGADPVPWAILSGDHQIGVTVVTLSESFDEGKIVAQEKIPIREKDTSDPLRTRLFQMGAELLVTILPDYISGKVKLSSQQTKNLSGNEKLPYARKFKREDGFESWDIINKAITEGSDAERLERKFRALDPWPGVWTVVDAPDKKRLKILRLHVDNKLLYLDNVQLEGKTPVSWEQFRTAYLST